MPDLNTHQFAAHYECILSPTYRVPVLYFSLQDPERQPYLDIDRIYEELVPVDRHKSLRAGGITGGISITASPLAT